MIGFRSWRFFVIRRCAMITLMDTICTVCGYFTPQNDWKVEFVKRIVIHLSPTIGENKKNMFAFKYADPNPSMQFTLLGTNISPEKSILKMIFLFPRWDMLIFVEGKGCYCFVENPCSLPVDDLTALRDSETSKCRNDGVAAGGVKSVVGCWCGFSRGIGLFTPWKFNSKSPWKYTIPIGK